LADSVQRSFRAPKGREERSDDVSFFRGFFFGQIALKEKSSAAVAFEHNGAGM